MSSAAVVICAVRVIVIYNYYIYYTQKWYQAYPGIHQAATPLKGYCTVFQHALKSLEITGIVLS